MKIAVLCRTGFVGKTAISHYMLRPRMPESAFVAVEGTTNESAADLGGEDVIRLKGVQFERLYDIALAEPNLIADIGATNLESFFEKMADYDGALNEFDMWVVPVAPERRIIGESQDTVDFLARLGVEPSKIRILPNKIGKAGPTVHFDDGGVGPIFDYVKRTKKAVINPRAFLYDNQVYAYLAKQKITFESLLSDTTDYRALLATETNDEKLAGYRERIIKISQARAVHKNLDAAFAELIG